MLSKEVCICQGKALPLLFYACRFDDGGYDDYDDDVVAAAAAGGRRTARQICCRPQWQSCSLKSGFSKSVP